ncbi:MAG TPA: hypothetical protein PKA38_03760 [Candidatus Levybacteria bacterium]|nr:hypothetical protein [Candidatus Levybacteria bacterium]
MEKLERDSRIRGYLKMHTDTNSLTASLTMRQREEFERHAQYFSLLQVFAQEWKDAGARGVPRWKGGEIHERQSIEDKKYSTPDDFMGYIKTQDHHADKGAVLLGNVALSLYEARDENTFSLYRFTARYNNDITGTDSAELPFIYPDHPDTPLTSDEKKRMEQSFQLDPTGAHILAHPKLWPRELLTTVLSHRLENERQDMQTQIQHYKRFAQGILQKNPDAHKPYDSHPEHLLSPNVAHDVLGSLGDF